MGKLFRSKVEKNVNVSNLRSFGHMQKPVFLTPEEINLAVSLPWKKTTSDYSPQLKIKEKPNSSYNHFTDEDIIKTFDYFVTDVPLKIVMRTIDGRKIELKQGTLINKIEVDRLRKNGVEIKIS